MFVPVHLPVFSFLLLLRRGWLIRSFIVGHSQISGKFIIRRWIAVWLFIIFAAGGSASPGLAQTGPDESTAARAGDEKLLRELTTRFYHNYEKLDIESQMDFWSRNSVHYSSEKEELTRFFSVLKSFKVIKLSIDKVKIHGDRASVMLTVQMSAVWKEPAESYSVPRPLWEGFGERDGKITQNFIRENGSWLLVEHLGLLEGLVSEIGKARTAEERDTLLREKRSLLAKLYTPSDPLLISSLHIEAARLWDNFDYEQAVGVLQTALRLAGEIGDKQMIRQSLEFLGSRTLGDHIKGLLFYQRSLEISEELGDTRFASNTLNSIGVTYKSLGDPAQAFYYFQKSVDTITASPGNFRMRNLAATYLEFGDYEHAREIYEKGFKDISKKLSNETEPAKKSELNRGLASIWMGIGNIHKAKGNYSAALDLYFKALTIYEESERKMFLFYPLEQISEIYLLLGNYEEALKYAERAAALAEETGIKELALDPQLIIGQARLALKQPDRAYRALNEAITAIEDLRGRNIGDETSQQRYFEKKISPYQVMIDLLVSQGKTKEALAYAEQAKARVLLGVLAGGRLGVTKSMTLAEKLEERKLTRQLTDLNTELMRENEKPKADEKKLGDLKSRLENARLELEAFRIRLYAAHPELKPRRGQSKPVTPDDASDLVPDGKSALLEYVVTEDRTYLFVLTKGDDLKRRQSELKVYPIAVGRKQLAEKIESYRRKVATGDLGFIEPSRKLYDLLLEPAREQLRGKTSLTVVPDLVLWNLPFQTLSSSGQRYLIEDRAIFYVPSLSVLREVTKNKKTRRTGPENPAGLLAFGNPLVGKKAESVRKAVLMGESLDPLPEAEKQVKALAQLYGAKQSRIYIREEAREGRVKAESPSFRVLQFATHGILNSTNPMYSHLVFSQKAGDVNEDGLLEAWEVMDLDLRADLVVLAACETARGRIGAGEGMIGMSWAFFIAGAPTTVASQWKVESSSTTELMLEFHRQLLTENKIPKAEALRQASLKVMKMPKYKHPSYWGGFILVGDGS